MIDESTQFAQKRLIEEFVSATEMFISEYYVEVLDEKLKLTQIFINKCLSWTIDEKEETLQKLYDLEEALFDRIQDLKPDAISQFNN